MQRSCSGLLSLSQKSWLCCGWPAIIFNCPTCEILLSKCCQTHASVVCLRTVLRLSFVWGRCEQWACVREMNSSPFYVSFSIKVRALLELNRIKGPIIFIPLQYQWGIPHHEVTLTLIWSSSRGCEKFALNVVPVTVLVSDLVMQKIMGYLKRLNSMAVLKETEQFTAEEFQSCFASSLLSAGRCLY